MAHDHRRCSLWHRTAARMVGTDVPTKGAGWPVDVAHLTTSLCSRSCGAPRRRRPMSTTGPEPASPNRYAQIARRHYEMHLPGRLAAIPEEERDSFFSTLGEQIADLVESYELALRGPDPADEEFMARLGRFQMARLQAEERARAELLPTPDPEEDDPGWDRPAVPVMSDLEICHLHGLDPNDENPEQARIDRAQLEEYRAYYKSIGRRPGLD